MKSKLLLCLGACVIGLLFAEGMLRVFARRLDLDESQPSASPFLYSPVIGYELKPHAVLTHRDENGWRFEETMNAEGFRGPEAMVEKPQGVTRLLALGDSVVEAMTVRGPWTWERRLERRLNVDARQGRHYEVLNSGIGGYVSWQARQRLVQHGLKYHPDLVITYIGWNDFVYSTLPIWKPGLELTQIQAAYAPLEVEHPGKDLWSRVKRYLARWSYIDRLISHRRDLWRTLPGQMRIVTRHQRASGQAFNARALALYEENLEGIYATCRGAGTRMALVTWPTILSPDAFDDQATQWRLLQTYTHFPLSTRELWQGYQHYQDAQRRFARRHPDILLIDMADAERSTSKAERRRYFVDLAHLSRAGNQWLADGIAAKVEAP